MQRAEDYGPVEVISHWHPNLTINMVDDHTPWVKGSVPPPLDQCKGQPPPSQLPGVALGDTLSPLRGAAAPLSAARSSRAVTGALSGLSRRAAAGRAPMPAPLPPPLTLPPPPDVKFDAVSGDYYPILYFNDYWNLQKDYFPINESLRRLPFRLSFCPLSLWRWQLYAAQSTKSPWNFLGEDLYEQSDEEQDSVKVRAAPWRRRGAAPWPPSPRRRSLVVHEARGDAAPVGWR